MYTMPKTSNNGGILGSGIFGLFGSVVNCNASDDSIYCNIVKIFNLLIMFGVVLFILYTAYNIFFRPIVSRKKR